MIKVDLSGAKGFFKGENPDYEAAARAHETLASGTGKGSDFRGWLELPSRMRSGELPRIIETAEKIKSRSKALVVIGIGGSYLGARAAINLLKPVSEENDVKVFFLGNGLSPDYLCDTLKQIGDDDFDVNVISKSGTTLEPAVSFRIFRELLKKKYGDKAGEHIFATTDKEKGALKSLANSEGWETFVVPDDVGGRYSVLSAVGLLPMAVAGIDVSKVISSAEKALKDMDLRSPRTLSGNMQQQDSICIGSDMGQNCSQALSRVSGSSVSGGSSFSVRAKVRTVSAYSPHLSNILQICIPWASSYRTVPET